MKKHSSKKAKNGRLGYRTPSRFINKKCQRFSKHSGRAKRKKQ